MYIVCSYKSVDSMKSTINFLPRLQLKYPNRGIVKNVQFNIIKTYKIIYYLYYCVYLTIFINVSQYGLFFCNNYVTYK